MADQMRSVQRRLWNLLFGSRPWVKRNVARFAETVHGSKILELGSGRQDLGQDAYSMRSLFDSSNEFIQSDVVPDYGHVVVDATTMEFDNEFDVLICSNVLEHVYDYGAAVERIHRALKPGGRAVISVPVLFPYHDEPEDFWRFTEYGIRRVLDRFSAVDVKHRGHRRLPFTLFVVATK
jgi:ubiquinone/menaquinone biosynthesis C-methylase UbiE